MNNGWIIEIVTLVLLSGPSLYFAINYEKFPRTKGTNLKFHLYFLVFCVALFFLPASVKDDVFSPFGVMIAGILFPVYASIRAVATPQEIDDKIWLQYWLSQTAVELCGMYVDHRSESNDKLGLYWYEFKFYLFVWLLLPFTDGASLLYENVTLPFLAPIIAPIAEKMNSWVATIIATAMNISHLWIVGILFATLPHDLKHVVAVSVGVVYPFFCSVVAATTDEVEDDTYWLTYYSCYGILYLAMRGCEHYLGKVPGFYVLFILSTVYLMLPMFQGAEKIFRHILVPLTGQQEMLIIRDGLKLRKSVIKELPEEKRDAVSKQLADSFGNTTKPLLSETYGSV